MPVLTKDQKRERWNRSIEMKELIRNRQGVSVDQLIEARNYLQLVHLQKQYKEHKLKLVNRNGESHRIVDRILKTIRLDKDCKLVDTILIKSRLSTKEQIRTEREGRLMALLVSWIQEDWNEMNQEKDKGEEG